METVGWSIIICIINLSEWCILHGKYSKEKIAAISIKWKQSRFVSLKCRRIIFFRWHWIGKYLSSIYAAQTILFQSAVCNALDNNFPIVPSLSIPISPACLVEPSVYWIVRVHWRNSSSRTWFYEGSCPIDGWSKFPVGRASGHLQVLLRARAMLEQL